MSIYAKCCNKCNVVTKRKCPLCGKSFHKFVVKCRNPATGKWKTKTISDLKIARNIEAKFQIEIVERNIFDIKKTGTIDFDRYLKYAKTHKITWKDDQQRWNKHVAGRDFTTTKGINEILNAMRDAGYAPGTVHHVLKLIRRVINWSITYKLYHKTNPCNGIVIPAYDNRVTHFLSSDDVKFLLSALDNWNNFRAVRVILFALQTGRRKGEICKLRWDNIDFESKTITCKNTKNGRNLSLPINKKAFRIILDAQKHRISEYVFPSSNGENYYSGISTAWTRFKKRNNIQYRFHDLRHAYASTLASSGKVDLYTIQKLLGHQNIELTQRYAHLTDSALRKATCILDDIF